jgi:hypothetical protein
MILSEATPNPYGQRSGARPIFLFFFDRFFFRFCKILSEATPDYGYRFRVNGYRISASIIHLTSFIDNLDYRYFDYRL